MGRTALHEAVEARDGELIAALAAVGADFTIADQDGVTPVQLGRRDLPAPPPPAPRQPRLLARVAARIGLRG